MHCYYCNTELKVYDLKTKSFNSLEQNHEQSSTLSRVRDDVQQSLTDMNKVRDHKHYKGKYRRAAHNKCNLLAKHNPFVPFYFHILSGYDAHLFFKYLIKHNKDKEVKLYKSTK